MLYICIFSNKFDLKQTIRVLHTGGQRFLRIPLSDQVWQKEVNKKSHGHTHIKLLPFEKMEECESTKKMASNRNQNLFYYCKHFNHWQEGCRTRIQNGQPCMDNRGRKYWPKWYTDEKANQGPISPISALTNYVTPLLGSRSVLTQIILNLCLASLTTCNKIYDIFAPGEKNPTQDQR